MASRRFWSGPVSCAAVRVPFVFARISAVERAGLPGLRDGQKVSYEIVTDRRSGKASADQLRTA